MQQKKCKLFQKSGIFSVNPIISET